MWWGLLTACVLDRSRWRVTFDFWHSSINIMPPGWSDYKVVDNQANRSVFFFWKGCDDKALCVLQDKWRFVSYGCVLRDEWHFVSYGTSGPTGRFMSYETSSPTGRVALCVLRDEWPYGALWWASLRVMDVIYTNWERILLKPSV